MPETTEQVQSEALEAERLKVLEQLNNESTKDFSTEEDEELRIQKMQESEIVKSNLITRLNQIDMQLTMLCVADTK